MTQCVREPQKTYAAIDLDAIAHNYNYTKKLVGDRQVICVIKANAYGHGAVEVAKRLEKEGADFFAVAEIEEALALRKAGITSKILILGYILPQHIKAAVENGISLAAASLDFVKEVSSAAKEKKANIHIKLNTGMNRTGFNLCHGQIPEDLKQACRIIKENPNIRVEGLFSHFAKAEDDKEFTAKQFDNYNKGKDFLAASGINPEICHICNSAGILNHPEMHLDAVRLGISLYGAGTDDKNYLPVMSFITTVVDVHDIEKNDGVSYGLDFVAEKNMKIAVIGAGYADGLRRNISSNGAHVLINGKRAKLIGRVCMDMAMIDVTDIENVKVGDTVTIWGKNGSAFISCDEQAEKALTISYELLCSVSPRVPRVYSGE